VTLSAAERWRSRWPTQDAARRYLGTIQDQGRRQELADFLGVELKTSPLLQAVPAQEKQVERVSKLLTPESRPPGIAPDVHTYLGTLPGGGLLFALPWPPSINHYWRSLLIPCKPMKPGAPPYRVQVTVSADGKQYRRSVRESMNAYRTWGPFTMPPGARLAVGLKLYPPNRRSFDIDNRAKALLDALTHQSVWADDSLVDRLLIERGPITQGGRVDVMITALDATLFEGQA